MRLKNYLNEADTIQDIITEKNIFIIIIGGVSSGKTYIYHKKFSMFPLIDIDDYTFKLSGNDWEKARKMVNKGIQMVKADLLKMFQNQTSVVNSGTGSNINGVAQKFKMAKENGMKTAIVLVDVDIKKAMKRNQERYEKGGRNLIPDYKVEKTNKNAKENFKTFAKMTDYSLVIKN